MNKKELYNSIMEKVAIEVKKALNEKLEIIDDTTQIAKLIAKRIKTGNYADLHISGNNIVSFNFDQEKNYLNVNCTHEYDKSLEIFDFDLCDNMQSLIFWNYENIKWKKELRKALINEFGYIKCLDNKNGRS